MSTVRTQSQLTSAHALSLYKDASTYFQQQKYHQATSALNDLHPENAFLSAHDRAGYFSLCVLVYSHLDEHEASKNYDKAIKYSNNHLLLWYHFGLHAAMHDNPHLALYAFTETARHAARAKDTEMIDKARFQLARIYHRSSDAKTAKELHREGKLIEDRLDQAMIYAQESDKAEALKEFDVYCKMDAPNKSAGLCFVIQAQKKFLLHSRTTEEASWKDILDPPVVPITNSQLINDILNTRFKPKPEYRDLIEKLGHVQEDLFKLITSLRDQYLATKALWYALDPSTYLGTVIRYNPAMLQKIATALEKRLSAGNKYIPPESKNIRENKQLMSELEEEFPHIMQMLGVVKPDSTLSAPPVPRSWIDSRARKIAAQDLKESEMVFYGARGP